MKTAYERDSEQDGYTFRVIHDPDDSGLPIHIENPDDTWLTADEALDAAKSVYDALGVLRPGGVAASQVSFNEGLMRLAAVHGKTVTFRYAKGDGRIIEQRTLAPTEVKEVAGHVVFTGYDPDRDEPRAYRIDRMKGEVTIL